MVACSLRTIMTSPLLWLLDLDGYKSAIKPKVYDLTYFYLFKPRNGVKDLYYHTMLGLCEEQQRTSNPPKEYGRTRGGFTFFWVFVVD